MSYSDIESLLGLPAGTIAPIISVGIRRCYRPMQVKRAKTVIRRARIAPKVREVFAPIASLKRVQRRIGRTIGSRFPPHPIAHAYTRGRGIITNAERHIGATSMLHIDLKDFFGSIPRSVIASAAHGLLTELTPEDIEVVVDLCCLRGRLPQGSPASPMLSNLICRPLDAQLQALARSSGCRVSRYSDDITFSTTAAAFPSDLAFIENREIRLGPQLLSAIEGCGFEINWDKVRFETRYTRLKATGLIVGKRGVTVPRKFRDNIRAALDRWERHGIGEAVRQCDPTRSAEAFRASLKGCIDFIGQVSGRNDPRYVRLISTYRDLLTRDAA